MEYRIVDDFTVDAARYWEMFFDENYNQALFKYLHIERELVEFDDQGTGADRVIRRRQRLTPQRQVPAFLSRFVKGSLTYVEDNHFTARDNSIDVVTTPTFMADRITTTGRYYLESHAQGVRRIWDGVCRCNVPVIGRRVEQHIVNEVQDSYRKTTDFTREWLAHHAP